MKYTGVWGDVGMYRWNRKNGRVVCRQLGYPDIVTVLWRCRVILLKRYSAVTWMDDVRCKGDESYLTNCSHDSQTLRSSLGFDAGVVCKNETQAGKIRYKFIVQIGFAIMFGSHWPDRFLDSGFAFYLKSDHI